MQERVYATKRPVKRMDECARETEAAQHEETLRNARRAAKRAQRSAQSAATLVAEIEMVLS